MSKLRLSNSDKLAMLGNLATMLRAGIPIVEAVDSLLQDVRGNQKKVLETLRSDLMQGKRVGESMENFPYIFDRVTVNLIKAAEEAGTLEVTLEDLREHIQKQIEFLDKIKFAMVYPVLILLVFLGVLLMILLVVVPRISSVFARLKVQLPLPTRILIAASDLLINQTGLVLLVTGLVVGGVILLYSLKRKWVLNIIYQLPVISNLVRQIDFAQFSRSLHLLLSSGLPITSALALTAEVVVSDRTARLIATSRELVIAGKRLSDGLRLDKKHVPMLVLKLIEAGERTGTLDKAMQEIAKLLDYRIDNTLKTLTTLLEPILLVIVGISVGGMMLAIIAPIYGLIGQVSAR